MLQEIHKFLSSIDHTEYQTIFIGVITSIVTSIVTSLIFLNLKYVNIVIKYSLIFIKKVLKKCFGRLGKYISYKFRLTFNTKKLTNEEISELQKKNLDESIRMKKLEYKALKKCMRYKCKYNELSFYDYLYLKEKEEMGFQLEEFEYEIIQKVKSTIKESLEKVDFDSVLNGLELVKEYSNLYY